MPAARRGLRGALFVIDLISCVSAGISCSNGAGSVAGAPSELSTRSAPARGQRTEDESGPQRPEAEVQNLALAKAIDRKFCRKRGCCVSGIEDAGSDRKGRSLVVATIDAGSGGVASCLVPPPLEPAPFGTGALDKEPCPIAPRAADPEASSDNGSDAEEETSDERQVAEQDPESQDCRPYEYRLIVHSHGKIRDHQLLSEQCNNGYGAAGVGEDSNAVDKEARTFSHRQSGGSAWRGDRGMVVGLDPVRVISVDESSFWTFDEDATSKSSSWNNDTFDGSESWSVPNCAERRKQEAEAARDAAAGAGRERDTSTTYNAVTVPRVDLPPAFMHDGWRSIALGNCSAFIDGDEHGFAIYGGKGRAADASLRAVVSKDDFLFVEITDDRWTAGGKTWVKEDHIELWLAPPGIVAFDPNCAEPSGPDPPDPSRQWGIRAGRDRCARRQRGVGLDRAGAASERRQALDDRLRQSRARTGAIDSARGSRTKRCLGRRRHQAAALE